MRRVLRRGLVVVALLAVVASATLPALAADLRPEVAAVRGAIDQADAERVLAEERVAAADTALVVLRAEQQAATAARDEAATRHDAAVVARQQAEARAEEEAVASHSADRRRDLAGQRLIASVERRDGHRDDLRTLVVEAWKRGGDTARIAGVVEAMTSSTRDVGTTFAAVERLGLGADRTGEHVAGSTATAEQASRARDGEAQMAAAALQIAIRADAAAADRLVAEAGRLDERTAAEVVLADADARLAAGEQERALAGDALGLAIAAAAGARAAAIAIRHLGGAPGPDRLSWPTDGGVTSGFGLRQHPILEAVRLHRGVDIPAPAGQPVLAAADGVVVRAGDRGGYGLTVEVDHGGGLRTLSAHLARIDVRAGQRVTTAQRVGFVGSTGMSTGPHLHFEVHLQGQAVDPFRFFTP